MRHSAVKVNWDRSQLNRLLMTCILTIAVILSCHGQLRELTVMVLDKPSGMVVQANARFEQDAMVFVYSSIRELQFRSSMDGIDQVVYREDKSRYELLVKPIKQILFVGGKDIIETRVETINPLPKDVLYFKVEEKVSRVSVQKGELSVGSTPPGAALLVNEIETVYNTPHLLSLPAGLTRIGLRKSGFQPFDTLVLVSPFQTTYVRADLDANWARILVLGVPDDAEVYLDDRFLGTGPRSAGGQGEQLEAGSHVVRVIHPSYQLFEQTIFLDPGESLEFSPVLSQLTGKLSITTYPGGADVFVDGRLTGLTPFSRKLPVGSHVVTVRSTSYREEKRMAVVKAGQEEKIDLILIQSGHLEELPQAEEEIVVEAEDEPMEDRIFTIVEETATPKGGMSAFYKYVGSKLKYPPQANRMGVEGKVYVEFIINRDGSIVEAKVVRGIGAGCDEEAVRVVESSPPWNPGTQRGKPVRQKYTLPIQFKLQ